MKNNIFIFALIFFIIGNVGIVAHKSLAHEESAGTTSAARKTIEAAEEQTLGSEKHAALEKVEPAIDTRIRNTAPFALGGISVVLLAVALFLKSKK